MILGHFQPSRTIALDHTPFVLVTPALQHASLDLVVTRPRQRSARDRQVELCFVLTLCEAAEIGGAENEIGAGTVHLGGRNVARFSPGKRANPSRLNGWQFRLAAAT